MSAGDFGVCLSLRCSCIRTVGRLDSDGGWRGLTWLDENGEVGKGEMFTACAFSEQEVGVSVKPGSRILRGQGLGFLMRPGSRILRGLEGEKVGRATFSPAHCFRMVLSGGLFCGDFVGDGRMNVKCSNGGFGLEEVQ